MVDGIDSYLQRPYRFEITPALDEQGTPDGWNGRVVELRWCVAHGATVDALMASLIESMAVWIESAIESGKPIPEALGDAAWSTELRVQVSSHLRAQLLDAARDDGKTVDVLLAELLAGALEHRTGSPLAVS